MQERCRQRVEREDLLLADTLGQEAEGHHAHEQRDETDRDEDRGTPAGSLHLWRLFGHAHLPDTAIPAAPARFAPVMVQTRRWSGSSSDRCFDMWASARRRCGWRRTGRAPSKYAPAR